MMMIHKAWSIALGNADDFMATASLLEKIDGTIAETYVAAAAKRGKEGADFEALMAAETWLTGAEAVEVGLADSIAEDGPKASATWDLSAYDKAPVSNDVSINITVTVDTDEDAGMEPGEAANNQIEAKRRQNLAALNLRAAA